MTAAEHDQIARLVDACEDAAATLPVNSKWRARFLRDADHLRTALSIPIAGATLTTQHGTASAPRAKLRLASVGGEALA